MECHPGSTLQRLFSSRKIVHSHWSYTKPKLSASPDAHEADVRAIRESEIAWDGTWAAKDIERTPDHYADDASARRGRVTTKGDINRVFNIAAFGWPDPIHGRPRLFRLPPTVRGFATITNAVVFTHSFHRRFAQSIAKELVSSNHQAE